MRTKRDILRDLINARLAEIENITEWAIDKSIKSQDIDLEFFLDNIRDEWGKAYNGVFDATHSDYETSDLTRIYDRLGFVIWELVNYLARKNLAQTEVDYVI